MANRRRKRPSTPAKSPQGNAFVVMPFGGLMDLLYDSVMLPRLTDAGYSVRRADTTANQRAITQDVIEGVAIADLVLADLTGRNANVF